MPTHEVLKLRDRVSVSEDNIATKDKLMEAIAIRLSDNAKASMSLLEFSEIDLDFEKEGLKFVRCTKIENFIEDMYPTFKDGHQ